MKIYSVIVCYKPDIPNLLFICQKLIDNSCEVVLVDNTERGYISNHVKEGRCKIISLSENTGIAHAQNIGIRYALEKGADIVVFFDQDSKIGDDLLPQLLATLVPGTPGIVGPVVIDDVKGSEFPSMRLTKYGILAKIYRRNRQSPYDVDVIISSGSAATAATFVTAGLMDEDFFIDFVDTEWCFRCRSKGVPIRVVPTAVMRHSIGVASMDLGFMKGFVHNPERCYYQIRNCFLLFRKTSIPFLQACKETVSIFVHFFVLLGFVKNRIQYIRNFILAIYHGISGVVGKKRLNQG